MFPMQGMGSNGMGMAGGSGLGGGGLDPHTLMLMAAMMNGGGGGMSGAPGVGTPLMPSGSSPMSNFIGARPPVGGMAPVVGGGMAGPPQAPVMPQPGGQQQPMDIASILKTPAGLQSLLAALRGNQEGLKANPDQQPTGGIPPGAQGAGGQTDPMMALRQLMSLGAAIPGMGQGYT